MDRRVPNSPPTGLLRVNRAHPLARLLLDCIVFGPGGQLGLVNLGSVQGSITLGANGGNWVNNPQPGERRKYGGGGVGTPWFQLRNWTQYGGNGVAVQDFSVFSRFIAHSLPGANNFIYIKAAVNSTAELSLVLNASGNQNFFFLGNNNDSTVYTTGFTTGTISDHGASAAAAGPTTYYANGQSIGTRVGTLSSDGAQAAPVEFGSFNANNSDVDVTFVLFYTWRRVLTAAEQLQLHLDPYCFLVPVFESTFKTPASVASAVVFRKTLSQIGGRVGSRQPQGWAN